MDECGWEQCTAWYPTDEVGRHDIGRSWVGSVPPTVSEWEEEGTAYRICAIKPFFAQKDHVASGFRRLQAQTYQLGSSSSEREAACTTAGSWHGCSPERRRGQLNMH